MSGWPQWIFCDICGWGDTVRNQGFPDDPHHFCHRHKADEVRAYMNGEIPSYDEWCEQQRDDFVEPDDDPGPVVDRDCAYWERVFRDNL